MNDVIQSIPGANDFIAWFGRWPSFQDAEVLRIHLDRVSTSLVEIHVFRMTSEVDATGHYVNEKHSKVRFCLGEIVDCSLAGFNQQNVLSSLDISMAEDGYQIMMYGIYGVEGSLTAKSVAITYEPGVPKNSIYKAE